ncbi:MAG: ATP-dependent 6-phosphofructokinase [Candidatus Coatesbacteria bacterium]|nr:ATP-dependent 6-phosphofructokinase [Candidatus Coatesbacteria bacterium]
MDDTPRTDSGWFDTRIENLGICRYSSPINEIKFIDDEQKILYDDTENSFRKFQSGEKKASFLELAGPRERLFFNPSKIRAAIVTCGGICPGLNDVIRSITYTLHYVYGCNDVLGIRYGYMGMIKEHGIPIMKLTPDTVLDIHEKGGTILGSSRGSQDVSKQVDFLENEGIDILFAIGGDGTLRGVRDIVSEVKRRKLHRSIIGIPKTIDNDINNVSKSFGFETAFSIAITALRSAHIEAIAAKGGIGLVKLMGRESGFIAASATLAQRDVNFCLIPEVDFDLEGDNGFLNHLLKRILRRDHALIVVAEGAGQKFFKKEELGTDKSGNQKLGDIGIFMKERISSFFKSKNMDITIRYIDPSYIVRSVPANPNDSVFAGLLGQMAVHAGMAGKTDMLVATWNNRFIHLPIEAAIMKRKKIDPQGVLWLSVVQATGQSMMTNI